MIPRNVVEILIEVGRLGDIEDPILVAHLESISGHDSVNREHWRSWDEITDAMPIEKLVSLTKGLVLAEEYLRWGGGSVAGAIWTFRQIQERDSAVADEVADWILPLTRNPWIPYGGQSHGARSAEEFRQVDRWRKEQISVGLAEKKESEQLAKVEREVRKSQRNRAAQDRDSDTRSSVIAALNEMTIREQLYRIATDEQYSIEFFPTRIADATTKNVLSSLNEEIRLALCKKLKGRKRGPWKTFKRRLLATFASCPWDREPWL